MGKAQRAHHPELMGTLRFAHPTKLPRRSLLAGE
jgi:hypothetical protein